MSAESELLSTDNVEAIPGITGRPKLAVCLSGGGTTLTNLVRAIQSGELNAEITNVIATSGTCGGIQRASSAEIPVTVVDRRDFDSDESFSNAVISATGDVDLIVLAGFLRRLIVPKAWSRRVLNIHPSLIPSFCGKGYYGHHVHEAAIDRGVRVSGCTVHFVDNEYDHGPIIAQRCVPVLSDDTAETLAARVFEQECQLYPEAIQLVTSGRLSIDGRRVLRTRSYS